MGKKKPFLDKKNAIHYRLVPKTTAEAVPEVDERFVPTQEHLEEQHKYGIYFDDDYDYMQHLREIRETATLQTLEEAAEQEERFILRAPRLQPPEPSATFYQAACEAAPDDDGIYDEDVDKALEGNFDDVIEGGLEDDFVALAGGVVEPTRCSLLRPREPSEFYQSGEEDEEESELEDGNFSDDTENEEGKYDSRHKVSRDAPRRDIDDRFDQLLEADYHDNQMGELDGDDFFMGGALEPNDERMKRMIKESHAGPIDDEEASKEWIRQRMRLIEANVVKDEEILENVEVDESTAKRLKWDCESYATQYSNIYNRPTLIRDAKTGKLSRRALKRLDRDAKAADDMEVEDESMQCHDDDMDSQCTEVSTYRPKGETPEQRRLRKQAVKEARRLRRQEKKGNKIAFAEEQRKFAKQRIGQIRTIPIV